ncbi:MAG: NYN domain-containing protein [Candidatus Thorarchaeota archaeon]
MERIIIFLDNSNIFNGFKKYNIKVDYEKLKRVITKDRMLESIILYEGVVYPLSIEKKKWYQDLKNKSGYQVKTSFDKITVNEAIEKKIDIQIAVDIISLAYENKFDTAVLVSGDGDFVPIVERLKDLNKNVELWAFRYSLANALKQVIEQENIFYLDDVLSKIKL